ncbi:MAG: putative membrane protein [Sulfitobacter sp.]|jgi:uncharacterized membrane protein
MEDRPLGAPRLRKPTADDFRASLALGLRDFLSNPIIDLVFASVFVGAGWIMAMITYATGQTFWLILAVLGFPLVGALAALGFYETSRRKAAGQIPRLPDVIGVVWNNRSGQLPWLAAIIVVIFLFWFFLGHMIFALFLGLSPMTNVSTSAEVFLRADGVAMLGFGTMIGAAFALLVFALTVLGMPMLLDRDVDFITAMLRSMAAVRDSFGLFVLWGLFIGAVTLLAMLPMFLGLFIAMPVLGHTTWHLYQRLAD